jgi:predicted nucleic acid-binding protein
MIFYAVIDTNVLISALLSSREDAATVQVVSKVLSGEFRFSARTFLQSTMKCCGERNFAFPRS